LWRAIQGEEKINRNKDGCARFRGPRELNRSAAEDQGSSGGVDKVTRLMPAVVVVPGQRDMCRDAREPIAGNVPLSNRSFISQPWPVKMCGKGKN